MHRFALAAAILALAFPASASATQSWEDASSQTAASALDAAPLVTGGALQAVGRFPLQVNPNAAPAFIIGFVAAGPAQSGVPCFACVNGAGSTFNMGLTGEYSYVTTGSVWQYVTSWSTITFKGSCKLSFAIVSGKKVIDSFSAVVNGIKAGGGYLYGFNRNRPSFSGAAILSSKLTCTKAGSQSTKATLYFQ